MQRVRAGWRGVVWGWVAMAATVNLAQQPVPQAVLRDLQYTQRGGAQAGDLYRAGGGTGGLAPAIVYIHGGSWRSGDKKIYARLATDLAAQGYAGFAIDYDLKPASFPLSWEQARDAVRFLRSHAVEYGVDSQKIYVAGDSAGGELAALVALAPAGTVGDSADAGAVPTTVAGAVILSGVFDLHARVGVIKRYLGAPCAEAAAACNDASPEYHVRAGAPPFFVGHGTADHVVPFREAVRFERALSAVDVGVTPFEAAGGPHEYWRRRRYYAANLVAVEGFLRAMGR